jgi:hypothetical protein
LRSRHKRDAPPHFHRWKRSRKSIRVLAILLFVWHCVNFSIGRFGFKFSRAEFNGAKFEKILKKKIKWKFKKGGKFECWLPALYDLTTFAEWKVFLLIESERIWWLESFLLVVLLPLFFWKSIDYTNRIGDNKYLKYFEKRDGGIY